MEKRMYCFAGVEVEITMPQERFYTNEYRLSAFRTDSVERPYKMSFQWVDELSKPQGELVCRIPAMDIYRDEDEEIHYMTGGYTDWKKALMRIVRRGKSLEIEVKEDRIQEQISLKSVLACMSVEQLVIAGGGFVLHSSYIDVGGKAILFTAPSGTGKSTQADLWNQLRGAEIINGDRAAVRRVETNAGEVIMAEGIPFAGSSCYCLNRSLPVEAIVFLEQAPVTTIKRLYGHQAFSAIWKGCTVNSWNRQEMEKLSETVLQAAGSIPVFHLACTPDESAIVALEKALKDGESDE